MCSVRHRPMPSAPNSRARRASSGVSALARTPSVRSSSAQPSTCLEVLVHLGLDERDVVGRDLAGRAVDRDVVALAQDGVADADGAGVQVDLERARAADARTAHAARDERRVRGLAALAGEDPLRGEEAGDVVGLGERTHEHDRAGPPAAAATAPRR